MGNRELPVINFGRFRKYPTRLDKQEYSNERRVCGDCLSGVCCSTEGPIYLTSFDVFRLATYMGMNAAEFLLKFTQDKFGGEDSDETRRPWIEDPNSSIVTYLRRRENTPSSPCIFFRYAREEDGTPRGVCSVHEGRPLACREFYFDGCKTRVTGELASLLAEGFEKIRDGEITREMADAHLARLNEAPAADIGHSMEYAFWVEIKRALNMDEADREGSNSYRMKNFQYPIAEKLNRLLSSKHLRFEEYYGAKPRDEQLMPYNGGVGMEHSAEYYRIMRVRNRRPSTDLFKLGSYPYRIGVRTLVPGVNHPDVFPVIPRQEEMDFLESIPPTPLFPAHDSPEVRTVTLRLVYGAILRGLNHLIRFSSRVVALGEGLEDTPGEYEAGLLAMIAGLRTSLNPYLADNPYIEPVKNHMANVTIGLIEERLAGTTSQKDLFVEFKRLCGFQAVAPALSADLRKRFEDVSRVIRERLLTESLDFYVRSGNPVEKRSAEGKPLNARGALAAWRNQVEDLHCAAAANFSNVDLAAFYRQSVSDLKAIPFRASYGIELCNIVLALSNSMSFHNTIACQETPYRDSADRLAVYAARLFTFLDERSYLDCESLAGFSIAAHKGLGLSYNHNPNLGVIVHKLLESQLPDGSWNTNPPLNEMPESQEDYLYGAYRFTWACVDGLRPLQTDVLNKDNAALGLI